MQAIQLQKHFSFYLTGLLRSATGFSVTKIHRDKMITVIETLAEQNNLDKMAYIDGLLTNTINLQPVIDATIPRDTFFLRDKIQLDFIVLQYIPNLIKQNPMKKIRILSIGCAQGEEPYSLAILLYEAGIATANVEIVGIDIRKSAIKKGNAGVFGPDSFQNANTDLQNKYFTAIDKHHRKISPCFKENVRLIYANFLSGTAQGFEGEFDIILCRNLLYNLGAQPRLEALKKIEKCLASAGALFLDSISNYMALDRFSCINDNMIYYYQIKNANNAVVLEARKNGTLSQSESAISILSKADEAFYEGKYLTAVRYCDEILALWEGYVSKALLLKTQALIELGRGMEALITAQLLKELCDENIGLEYYERMLLNKLRTKLLKQLQPLHLAEA